MRSQRLRTLWTEGRADSLSVILFFNRKPRLFLETGDLTRTPTNSWVYEWMYNANSYPHGCPCMRFRSAAVEVESAASRPGRIATSRQNCCGVPLLNGASIAWESYTGIDFRLRPSSWKLGWPSTRADVCREGARIGVLGTYAPSVGSRRTRQLAGQAAAAPQSLPGETGTGNAGTHFC